MQTNETLTDQLINHGTLKTPRIIEAFRAIDRRDFVPEEDRAQAYADIPLRIPAEQTISQPTTVAFMLELLSPDPGERILDLGSGSGWTIALLAQIVGPEGVVYGVERISELVAFGTENLAHYSFPNASIQHASDTLGLPEEAPFDRILVSASGEAIPHDLVDQLKDGGRMVVPVIDSIYAVDKKGDGFTTEKHEGFIFVPLVY